MKTTVLGSGAWGTALCPYEDCAVAGIHTHSGVSYCGNSHSAGFCGGGCAAGTGCGRWA